MVADTLEKRSREELSLFYPERPLGPEQKTETYTNHQADHWRYGTGKLSPDEAELTGHHAGRNVSDT